VAATIHGKWRWNDKARTLVYAPGYPGMAPARVGVWGENGVHIPWRVNRKGKPSPPNIFVYTLFFNELNFRVGFCPQINPQFRRCSRPSWAPAPPPAPCFLKNASRRHHGERPQDAFRGPFRPKSATLADYDLGGPVAAVQGALWCLAALCGALPAHYGAQGAPEGCCCPAPGACRMPRCYSRRSWGFGGVT